jgi:RNA polymerase sigma-70 factor (ECF subfamily)
MTASYEERKLVSEIRAGRREAFERLLDLYQDKVFALVHRMVGSQDAEDVAQDALIHVCNSVAGFRGRSSLSTWVYRVAMNVCLEHRRKRRPEVVPFEDDLVGRQAHPEGDPVTVAVKNEVKRDVDSAIQLLPEIHRDVVILHELQGLTYRECAAVIGCPLGTVKSRLSGAFAKLRELLSDYASEGGTLG